MAAANQPLQQDYGLSALLLTATTNQGCQNRDPDRRIEGYKVCMIERDLSDPDWIVGELLKPDEYLQPIDLGIEGQKNILMNLVGTGIATPAMFLRWSAILNELYSGYLYGPAHSVQKVDDDKEKEELKQCFEIVLEDEDTVDVIPLAVKPALIVN
ncbi:hypothetical protein Tco_0007753 [Tanacetum coccineum]